MQLDLSPKGVIEKALAALLVALLYAVYGFYHDLADLVEMKPELRVVQQYLVKCPCPDVEESRHNRSGGSRDSDANP